jgi:hypothetical protein
VEYPDPEHVDRARRITRGTLAPAEVSRQRVRKLIDTPRITKPPPAAAALAMRCGWQVEMKEAPPEAASRPDSLRQRSFMVEDQPRSRMEIPNVSKLTTCMIKQRTGLGSGCRTVLERDLAAQR